MTLASFSVTVLPTYSQLLSSHQSSGTFSTIFRYELHLLPTFFPFPTFGDRISILAEETTVAAAFPSRSQGPAADREPT